MGSGISLCSLTVLPASKDLPFSASGTAKNQTSAIGISVQIVFSYYSTKIIPILTKICIYVYLYINVCIHCRKGLT